MVSSQLAGALSGLASALAWGSGDFIGGLATRRVPQFQVVALAALSGLAVFVPVGILRGEAVPSTSSILWALGAGLCGAIGVASLYAGLARGPAAVVAPTATVVGAGLPVVLSAFLHGLPPLVRGAGILLGLAGIYLASRPAGPAGAAQKRPFLLAVAAGVGFGGYFILIAQVDRGPIFLSLSVAKGAALALSGVALTTQGQSLASPRGIPLALLAGVLDGGGNLFNLLAAHQSGIAAAAVLSSMAPAATVLLSMRFLRERLRWSQGVGVLCCLAALGLISVG